DERVVHLENRPFDRRAADAGEISLEQHPVLLFRLPEPALGVDLLRHIACYAADDERARRRLQRVAEFPISRAALARPDAHQPFACPFADHFLDVAREVLEIAADEKFAQVASDDVARL